MNYWLEVQADGDELRHNDKNSENLIPVTAIDCGAAIVQRATMPTNTDLRVDHWAALNGWVLDETHDDGTTTWIRVCLKAIPTEPDDLDHL